MVDLRLEIKRKKVATDPIYMKSRREAREWAMKVLYARELTGDPLDEVIEHLLSSLSADESHLKFCLELIRQADADHQKSDELIRNCAEKWELERIATLDRVILRMAICELLHFADIPPKVTINEAIEIAKKYSTEKSDKFINGILDNVLHQSLKGLDMLPQRGNKPA
ncbi:MAG: transcription antitermination factor NusB [bacterium]|nr:transcription antitermination factor NusB [bacterium]